MNDSANGLEFIGGPYDGHCQEVPPQIDPRVTIPVSLDVFAKFEGRVGWGAPVTSYAVYDFDPWRRAYLFVCQLLPN